MIFHPFFHGETVALFRFFRFRGFSRVSSSLKKFPQLKHLQASVHPMPPATHEHLRRPSWHDLWLAFSSLAPLLFFRLSTYSLSSDSFFIITTSLELHVFCNCNIYTSGYKSGSFCGTGIYQKHRKYLKLTYFSCFYRKCILFPSLVRHSHYHLKLLKRWNHVKN